MKVLIVDDEQLVRWFLERALKKWGHDVHSVSNTTDAIHEIDNSYYDVLFTDLRMPEGNGSLLINRMGDIPNQNLKVVVCSAFITTDLAQEYKKKGIYMLKKPFKLADLDKTLKLCSE
jgi:DNA-binding NtrC family response regulator